MGTFDAFNPGGGLTYHYRALRHGDGIWRPFRAAIGAWLREWRPLEPHLVVVGPSAGYTLPLDWLLRFERLTMVEPDPVARWALRRRLTRAAAAVADAPLHQREWSYLSDDYLLADPERLLRYLDSSGPTAILFSNVLGQLTHLLPRHISSTAKIKTCVRQMLSRRSWASYHDRVSGPLEPKLPDGGLGFARRLDDTQLRDLYAHTSQPLTLLDHDTDEMFPVNAPHGYFSWQLTPGYYHLIEAVRGPISDR